MARLAESIENYRNTHPKNHQNWRSRSVHHPRRRHFGTAPTMPSAVPHSVQSTGTVLAPPPPVPTPIGYNASGHSEINEMPAQSPKSQPGVKPFHGMMGGSQMPPSFLIEPARLNVAARLEQDSFHSGASSQEDYFQKAGADCEQLMTSGRFTPSLDSFHGRGQW
jgi:hypothetical protein